MEQSEQIARGEEAQRLLDNPLLKEALDGIEEKIIDAWKDSPARDEEARRNAHVSYLLLKQLREALKQYVIQGDFAARQLLQTKDESKIRRLING